MNKYYPNLFMKGKLGNRITKNRIVLSPMGDNMANADGSVSAQSFAYYSNIAKGGTGIIIAGVVSVDYPRGKTIACQHRLDASKYVQGWTRLAREIHRYGALLIPQIHHAGAATDMQTTEGLIPYRVSDDKSETRLPGSKVSDNFGSDQAPYKTLTIDEIKELEQKFIQTAKFAQMANCDGVEIHGISYLICQFFTKGVNFRTDEYGGSLENRMRFAINIIKGIRKECGPDFIIGIRMPVHAWSTDGFSDEDSVQMAKAFEDAGCDFIDANGGIPPTITCLLETGRYEQGDRVYLAKKIKNAVNIPVFAVGMLREPDFCEKVLTDGYADFVMLGRAHIADPNWAKKASEGKASEIRRCISCLDACYGNLVKNQSIQCVVNPQVGYEYELKTQPYPLEAKKVVIVGGGIAGMQAAITATERGHEVTILEATNKLGGQLNLACVPPHKKFISWANEWYTGEIKRKNIKVEYNCMADLKIIKLLNPDIVIMATGAKPVTPNIDGINNGVQAWDILSGAKEAPENKKVAVIGGGTVGCETAYFLAEKGNTVTILEMLSDIAPGLEMANKVDMLNDFVTANVTIETNAKVKKIQPKQIDFEKNNENKTLSIDYIVLSMGTKPCETKLVEELENQGIEVVVVGDALKPSKIVNATLTGFFAGLNI